KTLVTTIRSVSFTVFIVISQLRFFHLIHNRLQLVETLFPELAIADRPVADHLYCLWPKPADTLSPTLCLEHNPRPHHATNMFLSHLRREDNPFRQAVDRGRPAGEPLDHRPPGWIRQSRECCT